MVTKWKEFKMYANLRNFLLNIIPGAGMANIVYLGVIVFIIAGFFSSRKWDAFISTLIFAVIFAVCDYLFLRSMSSGMFLNLIALPFVITLLYARR